MIRQFGSGIGAMLQTIPNYDRRMPKPKGQFADLRIFCAFIGNLRSGHSLVGALIDAHPNAIMPHEMRIFGEGREAGKISFEDRKRLFKVLVKKSATQAELGRSGWRRKEGGRYKTSYAVPNQYQGRFERLLVIGTKHAQETSEAFAANPDALDELQELTGLELKLINCVRNPWDNVASMALNVPTDRTKARLRAIERFMFRTRMVKQAKERGYPMLDLALEDLIEEPAKRLTETCEFVGLEAGEEYLRDCATLVEERPNPTSKAFEWTDTEVAAMQKGLAEFPWFERYRDAVPVA
jgi:hypothetical protein